MSLNRLAQREKEKSRSIADDTLGGRGAAVKPCHSIVGRIAPTYHVCRPLERGYGQIPVRNRHCTAKKRERLANL